MAAPPKMASRLLPLELIDKCIGSTLWIIMKGDKVRIYIHCNYYYCYTIICGTV